MKRTEDVGLTAGAGAGHHDAAELTGSSRGLVAQDSLVVGGGASPGPAPGRADPADHRRATRARVRGRDVARPARVRLGCRLARTGGLPPGVRGYSCRRPVQADLRTRHRLQPGLTLDRAEGATDDT